jgi:hypothetical protein
MMREAIRDDEGGTRKCSQRSSVAIKRHSEAIRRNQRQSRGHQEALRGHLRPFDALLLRQVLSGNQEAIKRQSVAIKRQSRGNQWQSRGNQDVLLLRQVLLELLEIFELRQKPLEL